MKIFLVLSTALLGASLAVLAWLAHGDARTRRSHSVPSPTVEHRQREAALSPPSPVAPRPPAAPPPVEKAAATDGVAAQSALLQAQFAAQPIDGSWAASARETLAADLGAHASDQVRVRTVECRSTLCRIEIAVPSPDAAVAFMEEWVRYRTWTGPGFAASGGDSTLNIFVGRPGTDLARAFY